MSMLSICSSKQLRMKSRSDYTQGTVCGAMLSASALVDVDRRMLSDAEYLRWP